MSDEVDITAKDLPKVDASERQPVRAKAALLLSETKPQLDAIDDERRPAATLTLDEEPAATLDEPSDPAVPISRGVDLPESEEAKRASTRQRPAVPRALGGDGFEGASVQRLPEVKPTNLSSQLESIANSGLGVALALGAAVLIVTVLLILVFG